DRSSDTGHQGPRRSSTSRRDASRLGPPGPFAAHLRCKGIFRPPLPAPRLETLIKRPSVRSRIAIGIHTYEIQSRGVWTTRRWQMASFVRRRPRNFLVVEAHLDGWLDDREVRRDVEIARGIKRAVTDVIDLAPGLCAVDMLDCGQDRIADSGESLRDQRGADELGGITRPERDHAPAEALRHRQRHQIAAKIN